MANCGTPTTLVAIHLSKCQHKEGQDVIWGVPHSRTINTIVEELHPFEKGFVCSVKCSTSVDNKGNPMLIDPMLAFGDLLNFAQIKSIYIECKKDPEQQKGQDTPPESSGAKVVNAFNILMSGTKCHPSKKKSSTTQPLNRKDELYNTLVEDMVSMDLSFHKSVVDDEGTYIIQVITNALWYITNQHCTINDAAVKRSDVSAVPQFFEKYQGYNDLKRKKLKSQPMEQTQLSSHCQAIYSILHRPVFQSNQNWIDFGNLLKSLATCLSQYKDYLNAQLGSQQTRQNMDHPVRTVGSDISVEHRPKCLAVSEKYRLFDEAVANAPLLKPVLFDESIHLQTAFDNAMQRFRYFSAMQLSVPIDLYKYCPGGSVVTIVFATKVPEGRSDKEALVHPIRVVAEIEGKLPEYHTRLQKKHFKQKLNNIANLKPAVVDFIYKELAMDSSQVSHPEMQQRLQMISLGETGLVADLRELNTGRPSDKYDVFFDKMKEVVEKVTAVDDRRHGEEHLAKWLSLGDLINETVSICPEGILVPSKALVRLQFSPRNPYTHNALNFTSRIPVQYKIQRRQLRQSHVDQHFCAAQYKYLREKAVESAQHSLLICCDDKAKIPVGNPGLPISTGVRGKKSIAPVESTLVSADHDMNSSSLTPSVYLVCDTPATADKSFVRGKVHVAINDSVLQQSSPFRHAVVIANLLKSRNEYPKVVMKFSDGGTDQRNTLEAVKCACIALFRELDLDMLIIARCAPGNSWVNPAERIMSILNLGLQNCALERGSDEKAFSSCNSMSQIRELLVKKPELRGKWVGSIEPVQAVIAERFRRLSLKDEAFSVIDPVSENDIDIFKRHLRELFPDLDLSKLQKQHTGKSQSYQRWLEIHCRQRQYNFQIKKCNDSACCLEPTTPAEILEWLPDPVLENDEHYKDYEKVKGTDTTDSDRPSLKTINVGKANMKGATSVNTAQNAQTSASKSNASGTSASKSNASGTSASKSDASLFTAQYARYSLECIECRKPRVIYSKNKLTDRQAACLAMQISAVDYTCGSYLTAPGDALHGKIHVRLDMTCESSIELPYYSSDFSIGRKDLCCYCAANDIERDPQGAEVKIQNSSSHLYGLSE